MRRTFMSFITVTLLVPFVGLSAQQPPPLEPGARVRVTPQWPNLVTPNNRAVGTVAAIRGDTVFLEREGFAPFEFALSSVTRLEVSRGRHSGAFQGALTGAKVTGIIGLLVGLGWTMYCLDETSFSCMEKPALAIPATAIPFAATGALLGALIGAFSTTDRWEEVPLDRLRLSFAPKRDGFAVGMRIAF